MSEAVGVSENLSLKVARIVKAERPRVFEAWIKPELMHLWFAPGTMKVASASADARVGGAYRVEMKGDSESSFVAEGVYTRIVSNELLSFTWGWENDRGHDSQVTVTFHDIEDGTEVVLTHERLQTAESRDKHQHGWLGCLENLARVWEPGLAATESGCRNDG